MRSLNLAVVPAIMLLNGLAGCQEPSKKKDPAQDEPAYAQLAADNTVDGPVKLHRCMMLASDPQPVRIELHEKRTTSGQGVEPVTHELDVTIEGTLSAGGGEEGSHDRGQLKFEKLAVRLAVTGPHEAVLEYDSTSVGGDNPLARMMRIVEGAELGIELDAVGRVRRVHGLDGRWRGAGMIMSPPGLLAVQWLFRDISMTELVAEALFPPMPSAPVRPDDEWVLTLPANIPLVARIDAEIRSHIESVKMSTDQETVVQIVGEGPLTPAESLLSDTDPAIKPMLEDSRQHVRQRICIETASLDQKIRRSCAGRFTLVPPKGEQQLTMEMQLERTLISSRGR